jgi:CheY-like chemotaxis protein
MNRNGHNELSVLLVEDSPADVFLVRRALQESGGSFHLEVADDGEKAIRILDGVDAGTGATAPDILVLDVNVPRKTGNEVLERIRKSPRCGKIPVVMISSSDSPDDRRRALELGATEYFRKPSTLAEFMQLGKLVRRLCVNGAASA